MIPVKEVNDIPPDFFQNPEPGSSESIRSIIEDVRMRGDDAVRDYTQRFDGVKPGELRIPREEIVRAYSTAGPELLDDIKKASHNIRCFARRQKEQFKSFQYQVAPGVALGQRVVPLARVGVYVPGGRFPLVSSVMMGVIPAQVAGVGEIALCSPPAHNHSIHPAIVMAADYLGVKDMYRIGGAQAIAAMAHGTETLEPVDKIVGPGNRHVALAKKAVFGKVGIDLIAGPSEILIIADETADPVLVASDLLAQAEHDPEAEAVLITTSRKLADRVNRAVGEQIGHISTAAIASRSLKKRGMIILVDSLDQAVRLANRKAPEHLEIQTRDHKKLVSKLRHFGSLFMGKNATVAMGDFASGLNHTLPTGTTARYSSGLGVRDFIKFQTILEVNRKGTRSIGPLCRRLAETEGLEAHARSITRRLK